MREYEIRLVGSLEKVLPNSQTLSCKPIARLSCFYNQRVSFQIAYRFNGEYHLDQTLEQGTINPNIKVSAVGKIANYTRIRTVDCVPVSTPCYVENDENYLAYSAAILPDILEECDGYVQFIKHQWRALWVDVELPCTLSGADYTLEILFCDTKGNAVGKESITIHLIAAELPRQKLINTQWLYADCLADYYHETVFSERHWQIIEEFASLAVKRGANMCLTPLFTPALDTLIGKTRTTVQLVDIYYSEGKYSFGWQQLHRWIDMCKRVGFCYLEIGHLFSQWGAKFAPKVVVVENGKKLEKFGWNTQALSEEYKELLSALLPALTQELTSADMEKQTFFHISDEPTSQNADTYRAAKDFVRPFIKDFPIIDALSHVELYTDGTVERPVPMSTAVHEFLDAGMTNPWVYYCCAQGVDVANRFIAMPSYRNRILGVQLYKYKMEGFLHWGFNFYNSQYSLYPIDPYRVNDGADAFPAGDTFIVYPGVDGKPVESMRLPILHDAMNDVRAFELLEQLAGRDFVMAMIEKDISPITFSSYPCYSEYLMCLWESAAAEIEKRL